MSHWNWKESVAAGTVGGVILFLLFIVFGFDRTPRGAGKLSAAVSSATSAPTVSAPAAPKTKPASEEEQRAAFQKLFDEALGKRDADLKDCDSVGGVRLWTGETVLCLKPSAVIWKRDVYFPEYPVIKE